MVRKTLLKPAAARESRMNETPTPEGDAHRVAFAQSPLAIGIVDGPTGRWLDANPALLGLAETVLDRLTKERIDDRISPEHHEDVAAGIQSLVTGRRATEHLDAHFLRSDGTAIDALLHLSTADNHTKIVVTVENLTRQRDHTADVEAAALTDPLTGLANRTLLHDRLERSLRLASKSGGTVAVAVLDLDDFKAINDTRGHGWGDRVLAAAASRLALAVRDTDTVARHGGDEFVVLLDPLAQDEEVTLVDCMIDAFQSPINVAGVDHHIGISIGIALSDGIATADDLIQRADDAMYEAKRSGKNRWRLYGEHLHRAAISRSAAEEEFRAALDSDEFVFWYQPVASLADRRTVGVEALARWEHPDGTVTAALDFIHTAEHLGLLPELTVRLVDQLAADAPRLAAAGVPGVSVNLNPTLALDERVIDSLRSVVDTGEFEYVFVEIPQQYLTEMSDKTADALLDLRMDGIRLAVDDFGSDASPLDVLITRSPDVVKVHQWFVLGIDQPAAVALLKGLVATCEHLNIEVVAEGVEDQERMDALTSIGVQYGQGVALGAPQPLSRL